MRRIAVLAFLVAAFAGSVCGQCGPAGELVPLPGGGKTCRPKASVVTKGADGSVAVGATAPETISDGCPLLQDATHLCVKAAPYYASGYVAQSQATAVITSGATTVTLGSAAGFTVGQQIVCPLAGTSSADLVATISGISGATITYSPAAGTTTTVAPVCYTLGTTTTSGTVSPGTSVALASAATYASGQGVYIVGAGAASADYVGTISAVNGNTLTVAPATSASVTNAVVKHEDTAAIQAAITALAQTGGTVYVPDGVYQLNGALQDTGLSNAKILAPIIPLAFPNAWNPPVSIEIRGNAPAAFDYSVGPSSNVPSVKGTVFATAGTSGALFGGAATGPGFTNVEATFRNVTFRAPNNPGIQMVNALWWANLVMQDTYCDVGVAATLITQPTNANGICITLPGSSNSAMVSLRNGGTTGFYIGLKPGSHAEIANWDFAQTYYPISNASTGHPWFGYNIACQESPFCIAQSGGGAAYANLFYVHGLKVEHNIPGYTAVWTKSIADIYDPTNNFGGTVSYTVQPNDQYLTVIGAANLNLVNMQDSGNSPANAQTQAMQLLTDGATITQACTARTLCRARVMLHGNRTLAISGAQAGAQGEITVQQDSVGSRTLALPAGSYVANGGTGVVTLTATAGAADLLRWRFDGTNYLWEVPMLNFTGAGSALPSSTLLADALTSTSVNSSIWQYHGNGGSDLALNVGNNPGVWNVVLSESASGLSVKPPTTNAATSYGGAVTVQGYNFHGLGAAVHVTQLSTPASGSADGAMLVVGNTPQPGQQAVYLTVEGSTPTLKLIKYDGGSSTVASVTYNTTTHAWWRIRESGGTLYAETSSDGTTWADPFSGSGHTTVTWSLSAVHIGLEAGSFASRSSVAAALFQSFTLQQVP